MVPAPRIPRARVIALSHPAPVTLPSREWMYTAAALAFVLAGLLFS
jgi:hypothetical protein